MLGRSTARFRRLLLAALGVACIAGSASAQRGSDRFDLSPGEKLIQRDVQGRRTGSLERESSGRVVRRDEMGRRTGTIERGTGGRFIERDAQGRRTGTIERRR